MFVFLAVVARIFINPLSNVFQKKICSSGQHPLLTTFLTYFGISAVIFPFACFIPWFHFPQTFWIYAVSVGILGAAGNCFLVQAIRCGELSVLGPMNAYKSVIGILFGIVLLGEIPSIFGLLGVAFIIGGSYYIIDKEPSGGFSWRIVQRSDLRYRFAAMFLAGVEAVFIKKIILYADVLTSFTVWCFGGACFSFLFFLLRNKFNGDFYTESKIAAKQTLSYIGVMTAVGLTQAMTYYVFAYMPVGYALALFQLSAVMSVFYGWLFFSEKQLLRKLIVSLVMVGGSVIIMLFG